jgi:predicted transcriptional regulator
MKELKSVSLRLDNKILLALKHIANKEDRSLSYIIQKVLTKYVADKKVQVDDEKLK